MTDAAARYVPLGRHGVIGDLHTAALIDDTGSVCWYCAPRFDSPSLFAALLDDVRGGRWRIGPPAGGGEREAERESASGFPPPASGSQRYVEDTNVLQTVFAVPGGELRVTDLMPVGPSRGRFSEIHRIVQCAGTACDVAVRFDPRFDYATRGVAWERRGHGWLAADDRDDVVTLAGPPGVEWAVGENGLVGTLRMGDGDRAAFVLRFDDDEVHPLADYQSSHKLVEAIAWWREWANRSKYRGPYDDEVRRSLLALKLCCYEPTGATVAAPTTSLPETPGGSRNWDYRFAWLRDSAFIVYALERSGYTGEADAFTHFVKRLCRRADGPHVQTMYRIDGGRDLPERELTHLDGYGGARPVRVGNAAAHQYQLDVYGEVLEVLYAHHHDTPPTAGVWRALRRLVDWTANHWHEPDWSIWEARDEPRHYVFSKMMSWTGLMCGVRFAESLGHRGDAERWRTAAAALHADVLAKGWDPDRRTFVQAYGERALDAAVLIAPRIRFLEPDDPRVLSTIEAVRRELATPHEELIYRYRRSDGLPGDEGAFIICCFWLVQAVALAGDVAGAEALFGKLLARATPLGLYGEEIDPATGAHLGNFPQAFSHAALINAAHTLERLRAGAARRSGAYADVRDGATSAEDSPAAAGGPRVAGTGS